MQPGRFASYEAYDRNDAADAFDPQNQNDPHNFSSPHSYYGHNNPSSRNDGEDPFIEINHFPTPSPDSPNASDDNFSILPVMNDASLPPLPHKPVQLGQVDQWSLSMVDQLVQSAFSSLQLWMREREQLLMLKRLLLRRFCSVEKRATAWYRAEIAQMEVCMASCCVRSDSIKRRWRACRAKGRRFDAWFESERTSERWRSFCSLSPTFK